MVSQILIVMIAAIAVTIIAERRDIQPPLLLALVGLIASFIPGLPRLELEPEIILTVVLPPLLFSTASELSLESFVKRLGSIVNLGVLLVAVTTGIVGAVAAAAVPGMTLGTALVLGAVVSPPDAVTAVAVGRKLGLPGRLMTVLKGESLINDAAALTLFTFATASVAGTHLFIPNLFLYLGYSAAAGIIIGLVLGVIVHQTRIRVSNASLATVLSVVVPFTAYILAEELGASGVLAVVAAGLSLGHNSSEADYAARIQERQFWRTADALLEAFVFAYIGLQFRFLIQEASGKGFSIAELLAVSLLVLAVVIVVRIGWVFVSAVFGRWRYDALQRRIKAMPPPRARPDRPARSEREAAMRQERERRREAGFEIQPPFSWRENLVIGWTGMRGVVTLAAAAGIPLLTASGEAFPGRDLIQIVAFVVTIGTLLIQGLSLPWLIGVLGISDPKEDETHAAQTKLAEELARQASVAAVTAYRDRASDEPSRRLAEGMLKRMSANPKAQEAELDGNETSILALANEILAARRAAIIKARDEHKLDDEVMREVLEQMDLEQAVMANWTPGRFGRG